MVYEYFRTEYALQARGQLGCKRYFRNKHEYLSPLVQHIIDKMDVHFGFSRRGHSMQQHYIMRTEGCMYFAQSILLCLRKNRK
jgi:hypothetical protein